ncbi:MarR family transcriptional regulator [Winogradskya consettensis]|uniref:MarR family transcriptional regulator n=1 Tax=Winogradskya consettensis TaxID=113560 RepID=A0A919SST4_9ACTN|nr:MarR family transcriptional regulator [Actinoplanes consettensis]GIM77872.1 MarR family transcriptional regulator [Actinoplanes consettensis]
MTDTAPLDPRQLTAYLALKDVAALLEHAVEQQLKEDGGLTTPQFQILATLADAPDGRRRMTDLADGLVYSRSGLTYQAAQLEKAGLVTRASAEDDERSVIVTLTEAGRAVLFKVMPGHIEVVRRLFLTPLGDADITAITDILGRVRAQMRSAPPRSAKPRRTRS